MSQAGSVRRSTRLSTAARSVGSQSIATGVGASAATPSRRKGPLPKLKSRQSTAYGASGRLGAAEELAVPVTGFSQAFESQRGAAVSRREEPVMSGALNGDSAHHSPSPSGRDGTPSSQDYESDDPPSDDGQEPEEDSGANTSKSFGMTREAGMLRPLTPPGNISRTSKVQVSQVSYQGPSLVRTHRQVEDMANGRARIDNLQQRQRGIPASIAKPLPIRAQHNGRHSQRPVQQAAHDPFENEKSDDDSAWRPCLLGVLAILISLALVMLAFSGSPNSVGEYVPTGVTMSHALRSRAHHTWQIVADFVQPQGQMPASTDDQEIKEHKTMWNFLVQDSKKKEEKMNQDRKKQEDKMSDMEASISRLKEDLPISLVVIRDEDGALKIEDEFWKALLSKIQAEGVGGTGTTSEEWDKFVQRNEAKIQDLFKNGYDITKSREWPQIITRKEFIIAMEDNYRQLSEQVDKRIGELTESVMKESRSIATKEARKAFNDRMNLQSVALTNVIAHTEVALKKVNYFSPGLGARIDSSLTSPTHAHDPAFITRFARRLSLIPQRRPPSVALEKWDELGECWCSAPERSGTGKAQLAVQLAVPMFPKQITIEHIPKTMSPAENISNAPKMIELWVKSNGAAQPHYGSARHECDYANEPKGWICLGTVSYNIFEENHIQTFDLDSESPIPIDRAIVRVRENWGADHTCLYRVRLHGEFDGPMHEYNLQQ